MRKNKSRHTCAEQKSDNAKIIIMKKLFLIILTICAGIYANAQGYDKVDLLINSQDGVYQKGDSVIVWAQVSDGCAEELKFTVNRNETGEPIINKTISLPAGKNVLYADVHNEATHLRFNLTPVNSKIGSSVGIIVAPQDMKAGYEAPADLAEFWDRQIKNMRKKRMKPIVTKVESKYHDYDCFAVEIPMHEGRPVTGYLAYPKNVDPKSLPISILAHGAGVNKKHCYSTIDNAVKEAKRGGGAIGFDINAHGMELSQPQSYYDELFKGELDRYSQRPVVSHENFYFRLMYLRLVRALDYLVTLPQWDGERVLIHGSSQGGGQAGALAGIDSRVTAALLQVPALTDIGGKLDNGRRGGWPKPYAAKSNTEVYKDILPYYDVALLLGMTKASLFIEGGLVDVTCPPSCVIAGYNNAASEDKTLVLFPYRPHGTKGVDARHLDEYKEGVESKISAFYKKHLK